MENPARTAVPSCAARSAAGFTMVEMIVTVSLAAILMAIGVPMFKESIGSNRIIGQANDLVAAINLGRSEAIKLNQAVLFCRTADAESNASPACVSSAGDWTAWVVRANKDGSFRLVLREKNVFSNTFNGKKLEQPGRTSVVYADIFPDGRVLMNKTIQYRGHPGSLFPKLPGDATQAKAGWVSAQDDDNITFKPLVQTVTTSLVYRFNWSGPVVAKY